MPICHTGFLPTHIFFKHFSQNTRQGFLLKFRQNPTFGTLFSKAPKNRGLLPSIAFSGAKHCFSPRKALLFHIRSIAWLLFCLFSLQNQVQKCSKLLIFYNRLSDSLLSYIRIYHWYVIIKMRKEIECSFR